MNKVRGVRKFALTGLAVLLAAALLTGCSGVARVLQGFMEGGDFDPYAGDKNAETATYYNGYTGIRVTIPAGYYVTFLDDVNLTATPEESADLAGLNRDEYGDINLAGIQSHSTSTADDHCELMLYLEEYGEAVDNAAYFSFFEESVEYEEDGYVSTLVESGAVRLKGRDFYRVSAEVSHPENNAPYREDYYLAPVGAEEDGLFFVVYVNYWLDSDKSMEDAQSLLDDCFTVDSTLPIDADGADSGAV